MFTLVDMHSYILPSYIHEVHVVHVVQAGEYLNVTLDLRAAKGVLSPKGKMYARQLGKGNLKDLVQSQVTKTTTTTRKKRAGGRMFKGCVLVFLRIRLLWLWLRRHVQTRPGGGQRRQR
jgi:hypothetical protein